jgi:hypothetical protein
MAEVRILRDLMTRNGRVFRSNTLRTLSDGEATLLIRRGIAEVAHKPEPRRRKREA